jgi:alpha-D-ribose 1-methylphosphonate 5-triphosphate synthase subunit PhnG
MDDDELPTPGLSGWAGYALGRMAAKREQETGEMVDALFRRRQQPTVNVNSVLAQNQALAAENARLQQELAAYKLNFNNLRAWADSAEKILERLGALRD